MLKDTEAVKKEVLNLRHQLNTAQRAANAEQLDANVWDKASRDELEAAEGAT